MSSSAQSPAVNGSVLQSARHRRLLRDIAEIQQRPYPRIKLTPIDLTQACLVLTPERYPPLHLTISFGDNYPLQAPVIKIQTRVNHPNVFGDYICASILNTTEGYTPAYTLKGICIQMLSFFNSESIEQVYSGKVIALKDYKREPVGGCGRCPRCLERAQTTAWNCSHCDFGSPGKQSGSSGAQKQQEHQNKEQGHESPKSIFKAPENGAQKRAVLEASIDSLPDEIILEMLENIDFEDLMAFSQAWPRVRRIVAEYDLIRSRELQCFALKDSYKTTHLGIGIALVRAGLIPRIDSEFDLVSYDAFAKLDVQKSVQGLAFAHWLPLPISHRHWFCVQPAADTALRQLGRQITKPGSRTQMSNVGVLFTFMNDIVVRLNLDLERQNGSAARTEQRGGGGGQRQRRRRGSYDSGSGGSMPAGKSTLRHASEKAIESYFHLFHMLLCLATGPSGKAIVAEANAMIRNFLRGRRGKQHVPNLGHLLTALHISDIEVTEELRKAIITEAITRNVVWLLDGRGAAMAELGYLEGDAVSHYRLKRTFEGSRTSYRLLMFSELFRRTARPSMGGDEASPKRPSLAEVRDALFARHGAPPEGAAASLAAEVRRLQTIDSFPPFLREMGVKAIPGPGNFTEVLRETVRASIANGYSRSVPEYSLLSLRMYRDGGLDRTVAIEKIWRNSRHWQYSVDSAMKTATAVKNGKLSFFPERKS